MNHGFPPQRAEGVDRSRLQATTCPPSPCQDPGGSGPSQEAPPSPQGTEGLRGQP